MLDLTFPQCKLSPSNYSGSLNYGIGVSVASKHDFLKLQKTTEISKECLLQRENRSKDKYA